MRGISWLAAKPVSFSRRTVLRGVSKYYTKNVSLLSIQTKSSPLLQSSFGQTVIRCAIHCNDHNTVPSARHFSYYFLRRRWSSFSPDPWFKVFSHGLLGLNFYSSSSMQRSCLPSLSPPTVYKLRRASCAHPEGGWNDKVMYRIEFCFVKFNYITNK